MVTNTTNALQAASENPTEHEIHRGTIRAHHAKDGYDCPTIRPPLTFSAVTAAALGIALAG